MRIKFLIGLFLFSVITGLAQNNSVLTSGDWYKLRVQKDGVYKISVGYLKNIGIDTDNLDPAKIRIFGNNGGMLPQANNASRPKDLIENAILVTGSDDGKFNNNDAIIFYAKGPDRYSYDDSKLVYEHNIYSDYNFYFLNIGTDPGLRIENGTNEGVDHPRITSFDDFIYYEKDLNNLLKSGREWYSERFELTTEYEFNFSIPGIQSGSTIEMTSEVMAQSFAESEFKIFVGNEMIGSQMVGSVPDFSQSIFRYSIKGKEDRSELYFDDSLIQDNGSFKVKYEYIRNNSGKSVGYLNNFLIEFVRNLKVYDQAVIVRSLTSLSNQVSTFEIDEANSETLIWDVTQEYSPINQPFSIIDNKAQFGAITSSLKQFAVFKLSQLEEPRFIEKIINQNLRSISTPDFIIVAYPDFKIEAQRLAEFRQSSENITSKVVTTDQIYNEFSSGRQDVTAIRDFVKHLYDKSSNLKYLLLFGRSSYDYKNTLRNNTNLVPMYQSRNSLHPLDTYGSDDYYGFLEEDEGEWLEVNGGNHTMDIGIGRLPVKNLDEAKQVVDKIIRYSTNNKTFGSWRNEITFVADDGDFNLHQSQADKLATFIDTTYSAFNTNKLYLDSYRQISQPSGEKSPEASEALNNTIDNGSLIVNFTGHGGESGWMQESILDLVMIEKWDNNFKLPLFVTATCEFGRQDDPSMISGGEKVVLNKNGGGIAIVSTCRPVSSSSNFALNKAFYNVIFKQENSQYLRLGDIFKETKNQSIDQASDLNKVGNRNFSLIGDPTQRLAYPNNQVVITSILENSVERDTIRALSRVKVIGEIANNGNRVDNFNGTLNATVYDKKTLLRTLGNENAPFDYFDTQNKIFKGNADVRNGQFEFEFIVPKNISYQFDNGKISLYAYDNANLKDANGSETDVVIGGSYPNASPDKTGPTITLYLGDSTNTSLNDINRNTFLVANLNDHSGINISNYGLDNNITGTLDGDEVFILNDYYVANKNDFSNGWVIFPLNNLEVGKHSITVTAWDTYNNSNESTIEFNVVENNVISISELINFPNPFADNTTIKIQHNRPGENLIFEIEILNRLGKVVRKLQIDVEDSASNVDLYNWDGNGSFNEKLDNGVYFMKVSVISKSDGAKTQKYNKLILLK